jgi:hypothetical protein
MDQQEKECKESHGAGLVEVVSWFGNPLLEHGQCIFYFSGEINSAMG